MTSFDLTATDLRAVQTFDFSYLNTKGANFYRQGEYNKAVHYYRLAATMGDVNAISNLGYCYLYGRSIEANLSTALAYFDLAYQKGNPDAAYKLGDIYESPKWEMVDKELSLYYYQQAIKLITGKTLYELDNLSWYDELKGFPSLCFAFGRALMPQGELLTDIDLAFQFLKYAQEGYENEISNGFLIYQNQLDSVKDFLTSEIFSGLSLEDDDFIWDEYGDETEPLRLVKVAFDVLGKEYSYLCDDGTIEEGHRVLVPVGEYNHEKVARVNEVYFAKADELEFPLYRLKEVIKRYSTFDKEKVEKTVEALELTGRCLDLTTENIDIDQEESYDYLKTPIGYFWLEWNSQPIGIKIEQIERHLPNYTVSYALNLKPAKDNLSHFKDFILATNFDIDEAQLLNSEADEDGWGYTWKNESWHFGISGIESREYADELILKDNNPIPSYEKWHEEYANIYGFNLVWKNYESDEDFSVSYYLV